jgi:hypothetical protein
MSAKEIHRQTTNSTRHGRLQKGDAQYPTKSHPKSHRRGGSKLEPGTRSAPEESHRMRKGK